MRHKKSVPNYSKWVKKARTSRHINIAMCALFMCAAAACGALAYGTEYRMPVLLLCATAALVILGLAFKNLREAKAVMSIARAGNYAVMLSDAQQDEIAAQQKRRGQCFYIACFLGLMTPTSIVLCAIAMRTGDKSYLVVMGAVAFAALAVVAIASMYLTARLRARDSFFTVSPHGVLVGREVIPFESGDVDGLLKFADYYLLRFKKTEIFGISHRSEIIIPTDGVVRDGIGRSADEELVSELGLGGLFATPDLWYECRDYGERESVAENGGAATPEPEERHGKKEKGRKNDRGKKAKESKKGGSPDEADSGGEKPEADGAVEPGAASGVGIGFAPSEMSMQDADA